MAERWERLVDALGHAEGWTTATELADRLGVTTRTIRNYAAQANSGGVIVESGPAGYRLDRAAWATRRTVPRRGSSPAVRTARVIRSLIDATDGLDVYETAAANHVSDSTFEADLGRVRARLDGSGLSLERHGPRIILVGPETARRRLLGTLFREESTRGMLELDALRAAFPEVGDFRTALVAGLADAGYAPNEYGLNDVLLHTAIALDRVAANHPLEEPDEAAGAGAELADDAPAPGPLAELLSRLLVETFGTTVGPADLAHLTRLLETRAATRTTETAQADAAGRPISPRLPLVRRIVGSASSAYLIDLDDEDFIERLALHVDNLVARASESSFSRNPLTASIKAGYPLIYELAVYIASELARTEGIAVNDDEIAYIAMHVGAHLDRRRSRAETATRTASPSGSGPPSTTTSRSSGRAATEPTPPTCSSPCSSPPPPWSTSSWWRRSRRTPTSSACALRSPAFAAHVGGRGWRRRCPATSLPSCSCAACAGSTATGPSACSATA